ncbi:hypothetical protein ACFSKL_11985, partial [Belliella marina]
MKRILLLMLFAAIFIDASAQVGIGTTEPSHSSQLEIVASDKGILIPRVALTSVIDEATIQAGNVESLLVYNTTDNDLITPGYYYWYQDRWRRLAWTGAGVGSNNFVTYNPATNQFLYANGDGDMVLIDMGDLFEETLTTLVDNGDGTITYTNEANVPVTINMANGPAGIDGVGIASTTDNGDGTFTITYTDGSTFTTSDLTGPQGAQGEPGFSSESMPGESGAPGTPGEPGGPGEGVTIVHNADGVWVYDGTTNTWTNINGSQGPQGDPGFSSESMPGESGAPGTPGEPGGPGEGVTIVHNADGVWVYDGTTNTWTNINGPAGADGQDGIDGVGISSTTDNGDGTFTITYTDGSTFTTSDLTGPQGDPGFSSESMPGESGAPGSPGEPGGPGEGVTIVHNADGVWVYDGTTNTWTNINGPQGPQGDPGFSSESMPGESGAPGTPGEPGGPGEGVTIVHNADGVWVYDGTTNTWTNINGSQGPQGDPGFSSESMPGESGAPGTPGEPGGPGEGVTIVHNADGVWVYDETTNTWTNINGADGADGQDGIDGVG